MKYSISFVFGLLCFAPFSASFAQIRSVAEGLQGVWFKDGRNEIRYTVWVKTGKNELLNRDFSIVCGDTVMNSTARLKYDEDSAQLIVDRPAGTVVYTLASFDEDELIWENPDARPKTLSWRFSTGGYAVYAEDGVETTYRRGASGRLRLNFFALIGANVNYYARPASSQRFLARGAAMANARTSARTGGEMSLAAELGFPSTRFSLRTEFGAAYREVGIVADFIPTGAGSVTSYRDGYYRNANFFFGLGPGLKLGRAKRIYVGALFYTDLIQEKYFSGLSQNTSNDKSYSDPTEDIDSENGLMLLLRKDLKPFGSILPSIYVRYTQGLNNTRLRAFSAGVSVSLEKL